MNLFNYYTSFGNWFGPDKASMAERVSIEALVADYLQKKGYSKTLDVFQNETGFFFKEDVPDFEPLEEIVNDRHKYLEHHGGLQAVRLRPVDSDGQKVSDLLHLIKEWEFTDISTRQPIILPGMLSKSLSLNASIGSVTFKDKHGNSKTKRPLLVSGNDRVLKVIDIAEDNRLLAVSKTEDSRIIFKSFIAIENTDLVVAGGMDGFVYTFQLPVLSEETGKLKFVTKTKLHNRVINRMEYLPVNEQSGYVVSIGFDMFLSLARIDFENGNVCQVSRFKLLSNATDVKTFSYGNDMVPVIIVSRLDSTVLSVFTINTQSHRLVEITRISLNDAEFSTHLFSPMSLAVYSQESTAENRSAPLIAVGTSHVPYMRIITVKFPNIDRLLEGISKEENNEQKLVGIHTFRGLIIANVNAMSPQDKYSNPLIHWKPDGTGVWIASDDGLIRGVNFANNHFRLVKQFRAYDQDSGARFKCLQCAVDENGNSVLVTASSDKQLYIWK